ncbi:trehalase [Rhizoctonia solani]|uniref:alpha,alpha-trehalase n=1 Tax=Rhizoctonia solani TaxID=456999 RepID=A0A8H8P618_9AGAM|nr:trehalase [Rhizoctonia solani]QRW25353.1 trehalase [Rhizoctonia solani]
MKGALNLWLTLAFATATLSYDRPSASIVMNDRAAYHAYALNDGMCNQRGNPQRSLVIPGPEIVSQFSVCQGRNEFGELVSDTQWIGVLQRDGMPLRYLLYLSAADYAQLIHLWNDARDHIGDSKTFVDRASNFSGSQINIALYHVLSKRNFTVSEFLEEVDSMFEFYTATQARTFRAWTKIVHHYWNNLDRTMIQNCFNDKTYGTQAQLLPGPGSPSVGTTLGASGYSPSADEQCATSIIRLEHPFKELRWWAENRGIAVKSPRDSSVTHFVYHYNVNADGPRPESYAEDWMRRVQIRRIIPVDLNSILYRCHILIAELYERAVDDESPYAWQHKQRHEIAASLLKSAILDLHWNENKTGFYDFELDTHGSKLKGPRTGVSKTFGAELHLRHSGAEFGPNLYGGPLPATVTKSGQQWDFPNAWPPLQYVAIKALQNIPYNLSTADAFRFAKTSTPQGQLGVEYDKLPVMDGENITGRELDGSTSSSWRNVMLKELSMRYMTSAFCNWNVTAKLRDDEIEAIVQDNPREDAWLDHFPGAMYEKLNAWDVPVADMAESTRSKLGLDGLTGKSGSQDDVRIHI